MMTETQQQQLAMLGWTLTPPVPDPEPEVPKAHRVGYPYWILECGALVVHWDAQRNKIRGMYPCSFLRGNWGLLRLHEAARQIIDVLEIDRHEREQSQHQIEVHEAGRAALEPAAPEKEETHTCCR